MIGICTDSGAQLPAGLIRDLPVEVVPLTVTLDGVPYLEHVELDADAFYARFAAGARPQVSTAAPSPGRFAAAYAALAARGAGTIVSVHTGSELSGTVNAARLAAADAPVHVRIVDTGSASFVVTAAAWSAADVLREGGSAEDAVQAAEDTAARCGNIFVVGTLDLARAGGRLRDDPITEADDERGAVPVLRLAGGKLEPVGHARTVDDAVRLMADDVTRAGPRLRAGVGHSDDSSNPVAAALASRLAGDRNVAEVVRYRVGPSVGAHTGPGTAGAVYWPI